MKTVTIPTFNNPFFVTVNGRKYSYPAGSTQEVPDEVAEVINNIIANSPFNGNEYRRFVSEINENSSDLDIPTARAVYKVLLRLVDIFESKSNKITEFTEIPTDEQYISAKLAYDMFEKTILNSQNGSVSRPFSSTVNVEASTKEE